ncbi:MAG: type II secretion system protein [Alphaproteobacteria bacterium 64-11]|nr:type II secretion system F family protein [Alphaproteobacteria bacterium]OJU07765.1 MAG: type II secretion system protein [Alphaproteobacteria bacterium 64-11]
MVQHIMTLLFDRNFLTMMFVGVLAFATVVTLGIPLLERSNLDDRLKTVARRREELRARHHAALNNKRVSLRVEPVSFMKNTLERFRLANMLESENTREKLASAGYRGQAPLIAFMFFRFVMPFIVLAVGLFYLFVMTHFQWTGLQKALAAVTGGLLGFYLPDLFVSNMITRRQQSIMRAFPDALDLMLICVESGMSIESAFTRVAAEIGTQSPELAEELALTTAELSYLPDRRQAFDNLAKRCGHQGVKAVAIALNQAEKYGTPMGQALRVTANENREMRMQDAERKAASLPAKLTVPMILFFLPSLFIVILGPAIIQIKHMM